MSSIMIIFVFGKELWPQVFLAASFYCNHYHCKSTCHHNPSCQCQSLCFHYQTKTRAPRQMLWTSASELICKKRFVGRQSQSNSLGHLAHREVDLILPLMCPSPSKVSWLHVIPSRMPRIWRNIDSLQHQGICKPNPRLFEVEKLLIWACTHVYRRSLCLRDDHEILRCAALQRQEVVLNTLHSTLPSAQ